MNEAQVNAQFAALVEQRNNALNQVVNLAGEIAVLKQKLEAATALVSENTTEMENPNA